MGHRGRVRQTGKAAPSMAAHHHHNDILPENRATWAQIAAERAAEEKARGIRFERVNEDAELDEAA